MSARTPYSPPKASLASGDSDEPVLAGFWRRFAAYWLDVILLYIITIAVTLGMVALGSTAAAFSPLVTGAMAWLYFALMHSSEGGATLGKKAFGIKVTRLDGERVSFLRATGRYFATWISAILLLIGYIMAGFTDRKQALHDMIASTLVVRADADPDTIANGRGTMKLTVGVWLVILLLGPIPVIGVLAAVSIPAYNDYLTRSQITEAVAEARSARTMVEAYYGARKQLPANLQEAGYTLPPTSKYVARVTGRFDGPTIEIRAEPSPAVRAAQGGAVLLRSPAAPAAFEWTCSGDGIPNKYLPANCRQ
jgi:uncharacterized RDD family membrane protein YckC/Tfp pilus assembly protein PilE